MFSKKFYLKLLMGLLLMAFTVPSAAQADELTMAGNARVPGTYDYAYVPVFGNYLDTQGTYSQTVYPKDSLTSMVGANVTKVKYYVGSAIDGTKVGGAVLEISLMETSVSTLSSALSFGNALAEFTIQGGETEVEFDLSSNPFTYTGNNNLAVQVRVKTPSSSYYNVPWYYTTKSDNVSYYHANSNSGTKQMPKTTFTYEAAGPQPVITVDPTSYDFGALTVGQNASQEFTVTTENLTEAVTVALSDETNFSVSAIENGKITVTYNPQAEGSHSATVTLTSGNASATISVTGSATAPAQPYAVTVNPENGYDFGNVLVDNTKVWTITVTNNGTESVTPTLTGLEAPFTTNYTAAALAAGQSVNIEITFAPTQKTDYSNAITLSFPEANGAIASYTYNLTGRGVDSFEPTADNEVVKLITVDKRSIYEPNFVDPNPEHSQTPQQLNCYDMRFRMAQPDDPAKQIKAGDLRPGNNLYEFYAIDDFGTEFRFATINLFAEGGVPISTSAYALEAPITVTPSVTYYSEDGMPVHPTFSHNTTLNYTEKTYNSVNELVDLEGVIDYVNDTWSANTATNAHPDHYKFQIRGVGQYGELITSLTAEYVKTHMTGYGGQLIDPEGWSRDSFVGPNNELDDEGHEVDTYYFYDLYITNEFLQSKGITGPVTVVINTTLSKSGFNADEYKTISVNGVEQIIAKEKFKDYSWTVPLVDETYEGQSMGIVIRSETRPGSDFNKTQSIYIYGGGTGVSNIDTVGIYKSSMNVKAYTKKQVDEDTNRNLVAMNGSGTTADVNVLAYADPAVTGYVLYKNTSASTSGMTQVASANHEADGDYSVNSTGTYNGRYDYVRDESLGSIDGMWLPMYPANASEYYLPVTWANGVGDDGVVRSEGNTYGSAMQQVEKNGSVAFESYTCYKSNFTWEKDGVTYAIYYPEVVLSGETPTGGYQLYNYRLWVDYDDNAPAWDFDENLQLIEKMDRPLYSGQNTHIGGVGTEGRKDSWAFVAPANLEQIKLVARFYYKKTSGSKARPTDSDRLYYLVENQVILNKQDNIITSVTDVKGEKQVAGVKYYNVAGMESDKPFSGVNIVVTRYTDGSTSTSKVLK